MPNYSCDAINNAFIAESGRIGGTLAKKLSPRGKWRAMIPWDEWDDGMGIIHSNLIWERTVPALTYKDIDSTNTAAGDFSPSQWSDANHFSTGTPVIGNGVSGTPGPDAALDDLCLPEPEVIRFGQTTKQFWKQFRNIQTDLFCVEDFRDDYKIRDMLNAVKMNLGWVSHYVWENRCQDMYLGFCDHKLTERATFDIQGTSFDATNPPTSKLLNGTLEQIYQWLVADGAAEEGSIGKTNTGMPVFTLFTDMNTDRDLIRQDPELRADFRYDRDKVHLLTDPFGEPRAWNNFKHVFNPFQPRFEIVNNKYRRVLPYKDPEAASKGFKQELQKSYIYASYAISFVVVGLVYTMQVPRPITAPGGDFTFKPVNYMGDFAWLNILDIKCNPRGTKGLFDAIYSSAGEPKHTWYGFSVMHKNCPPARHGVDCYEYEAFNA